jgi:PAS domain S-box-containing protein
MRSCLARRAALLSAFALAALAAAAQSPRTPSVLVINSYHKGLAWTDSVMDGIDSVLGKLDRSTEVQVEYMDAKRFPSEEDRKRFAELISYKARNRDYRVVIATDEAALKAAIGLRPGLYPNAGIVFCALDASPEDAIGAEKEITGVCERWDAQGTLSAIHSMQRGVKKLVVVHDYTPGGLETMGALRDVMESFKGIFSFQEIPQEPVDLTLATLESLKPGSAVLLLGYNQDSQNRVFESDETAALFASHAKVPVYTMDEPRLSGGVIGGSVLSGKTQGTIAANMALSILRGSKASQIEIVRTPVTEYVFDYSAIRRFGISEASLPKGARIVNWPESFFWRYRYELVVIAAICFGLILLVVVLSMNVIIRRRVEDERTRLVVILESTTDLVCTATMDMKLQYMNGSGRQLLGWTSIGRRSLTDMLPKEAVKKLMSEALPTIERSGRWIGETSIRSNDGRVIPVSQVLMLHTAPKGKRRYVSTIIRDISGRLQTEAALRESEENLELTLNAIEDSVIAADSQGVVVRMNPAAEALTLIKGPEAVGKPMSELFTMKDENGDRASENIVDFVLKAGKPVVSTGSHRLLVRRDGSERAVSDSAAPIRDRTGATIGAVILIRDLSEETKLQERLRQSQRMEVIGHLAGGIAHDFNNILTAILGSAQLINMNLRSGSEEQLLSDEIVNATMRATDLTKQLTSFSQGAPLQTQQVNIHPIIAEAAESLSRSVDKLIAVQQDLKAASDLVSGDQSMLHSAILNLGANARDAMPSGGEIRFATRTVTLGEKELAALCLDPEHGDFIELSVSDTGSGMSEQVRNRLFEPYFTTKSGGRGTGLGLAAVYGCVQRHKGQITVESKEGRGTTFTIYLPLSHGTEEPREHARHAGIGQAHGHVLLIDDEESIRRTTASILKAAGYSVSLAEDGKAGLDIFREKNAEIDIVLLDLIMPNMSGREVFFMLKEIKPDVKVFLYSGYAQHQVTEELIKNGALGLLNKPFRMEELMRKLASVLKK